MKNHIWPSRRAPRSNQTPPKDLGHMISYTPNQCPYQVSISYSLRFLRYSPDKILQIKVTTARSKVKPRSHHDIAHLHPPTNVPTKYQLHTPYGFRDIARTRFSNSRSLRQGQIKVTPRRCTPTPPTNVPTKYQLHTPYGFRDKAQTRFSNSRLLRQGQSQIKVTPWRWTPTPPNQCP